MSFGHCLGALTPHSVPVFFSFAIYGFPRILPEHHSPILAVTMNRSGPEIVLQRSRRLRMMLEHAFDSTARQLSSFGHLRGVYAVAATAAAHDSSCSESYRKGNIKLSWNNMFRAVILLYGIIVPCHISSPGLCRFVNRLVPNANWLDAHIRTHARYQAA